jgi:predicted translin family RNA/ssDNA-binding protein
MTNQFFYTRKEGDKEFTDSFNVNKVIRTVMLSEDDLLVLMDDIHERTMEQPNIDLKTNMLKGVIRKRDVYQSEIHLTGDDIVRFKNSTNISLV